MRGLAMVVLVLVILSVAPVQGQNPPPAKKAAQRPEFGPPVISILIKDGQIVGAVDQVDLSWDGNIHWFLGGNPVEPAAALQSFEGALQSRKEALLYQWRGLAWLSQKRKRFDLAIIDFSDSLRLNPNQMDAYTYRGLAWLRLGHADSEQLPKALADFTRALTIAHYDNNHAVPFFNKPWTDRISAGALYFRANANVLLANRLRDDPGAALQHLQLSLEDLDEATLLNPVAQPNSADGIAKQVQKAIRSLQKMKTPPGVPEQKPQNIGQITKAVDAIKKNLDQVLKNSDQIAHDVGDLNKNLEAINTKLLPFVDQVQKDSKQVAQDVGDLKSKMNSLADQIKQEVEKITTEAATIAGFLKYLLIAVVFLFVVSVIMTCKMCGLFTNPDKQVPASRDAPDPKPSDKP